MSSEGSLHLISDNNDDTLNNLMTFCMKLVHHSQWKSIRVFHCGSSIEIPLRQTFSRDFKVNDDMLDIDRMMFETIFYVFGRYSTFSDDYNNSVVRIYNNDDHTSYDVHAGYVRLIQEKDNTELMFSDIHKLKNDEAMHGPAVLKNNKTIF